MCPSPERRVVKLPCSGSRRDSLRFCKLLESVDHYATTGFHFHGRILNPGSVLGDEATQPDPLVVLECAGTVAPVNRKRPCVWILWTWDREFHYWVELGRSVSHGCDWVADLREPARRALNPAPRPKLLDFQAAAGRALAALDRELEPLREKERVMLLGIYHDELAHRIARGY